MCKIECKYTHYSKTKISKFYRIVSKLHCERSCLHGVRIVSMFCFVSFYPYTNEASFFKKNEHFFVLKYLIILDC